MPVAPGKSLVSHRSHRIVSGAHGGTYHDEQITDPGCYDGVCAGRRSGKCSALLASSTSWLNFESAAGCRQIRPRDATEPRSHAVFAGRRDPKVRLRPSSHAVPVSFRAWRVTLFSTHSVSFAFRLPSWPCEAVRFGGVLNIRLCAPCVRAPVNLLRRHVAGKRTPQPAARCRPAQLLDR